MKEQDLAKLRIGAELQNYGPYIAEDLDAMKLSVVASVMKLITDNDFTPEVAQAKWMEYIAYERLASRINGKIELSKQLAKSMPDLEGKKEITYGYQPKA